MPQVRQHRTRPRRPLDPWPDPAGGPREGHAVAEEALTRRYNSGQRNLVGWEIPHQPNLDRSGYELRTLTVAIMPASSWSRMWQWWSIGLVFVIVQSSVLPSRVVWSSRVGSKVSPAMVNLIPPGPMPMAKVNSRRVLGGPCGVGGAGSDAGNDAGGAAGPVTTRVARVIGRLLVAPPPIPVPPIMPALPRL